ncbi:MAG: electron transport complex subunit E [Spirochaetes bacterium]|nr:electron transport complex subunit E [Spirochaetota bacterium]
MSSIKEFTKGIIKENPTFILMLGLCPTLAVSVTVINGIGMGIATMFVLLGSNIIVSLLRKVIPDKIRIPSYIVIIATFVTIVDYTLNAYVPSLHKELGIFIPLIVVNCIILGRAEAFANKNSLFRSVMDALGMGLGFTFSLIFIALVREVLGSGTITLKLQDFGWIWKVPIKPMAIMVLPPGAFITIGILMGILNSVMKKNENC